MTAPPYLQTVGQTRSRWIAATIRILAPFAVLVIAAVSAQAIADTGAGYPTSDLREGALRAVRAKPLEQLGEQAIRFSSQPALGGPATVIEIRPDSEDDYFRVTVHYLVGHPSSNWDRRGSFYFWIVDDDFAWLLSEVERAEREASPVSIGSNTDDDADREIVVCTDGPGYLTEIRSKGRTRSIGGFCGDHHPNRRIAALMARLVRYGTSSFLGHLSNEGSVTLRDPTAVE